MADGKDRFERQVITAEALAPLPDARISAADSRVQKRVRKAGLNFGDCVQGDSTKASQEMDAWWVDAMANQIPDVIGERMSSVATEYHVTSYMIELLIERLAMIETTRQEAA